MFVTILAIQACCGATLATLGITIVRTDPSSLCTARLNSRLSSNSLLLRIYQAIPGERAPRRAGFASAVSCQSRLPQHSLPENGCSNREKLAQAPEPCRIHTVLKAPCAPMTMFPAPVGRFIFPSDFAPSIVFAILYGLTLPLVVYGAYD